MEEKDSSVGAGALGHAHCLQVAAAEVVAELALVPILMVPAAALEAGQVAGFAFIEIYPQILIDPTSGAIKASSSSGAA